MPMNLDLNDLLDYTDWQRQKWHDRFRQHGEQVLKMSAGPHGDGRFATVGELVRHIFSAEKRYVERLSDRPVTDTASLPTDNIETLFQFGQLSRNELKEFVEAFPDRQWDTARDLKIGNLSVRATPRKIVMHAVMHEIRHWAQIATLLRLNGLTGEFHDFLFSPVMGGEIGREQGKA